MAGIFGSKKPQSQQSPALSGLNIQTSAAGKVIPVFYGQVRLAPNLLWYANFQAHEHVQEQGKGGGGGCFVAGTLVATPAGDRPIEALVAGDRIFCVDDVFEVIEGAVVEAHKHATAETGDRMVRVDAGDRTLYVTRGHYVYATGVPTEDGNGVPVRAEQLMPGIHSLVGIDGTVYPVSAVDDAPDVEFIYNLSVAPTANYFASGVLVHNGGGSTKTTTYTYTADLLWGLAEGYANLPNDRVYIDKAVTTAGALGMTLSTGSPDAVTAPWSYLTTNYPSQAIPYPGIAWAGANPYDLGDNVQLPNFNFEVSRDGFPRDPWAGGTYSIHFFGGDPPWLSGSNGADLGPTDIIYDILTNGRYGCGLGPQVGNTGGSNFAHDLTVPTSPYQFVISGGGTTGGDALGIAMGPAWLIEVLDAGTGLPLTQLSYRAGVDPGTGNFMVTDNLDQYLTQPSVNYTERPLGGSLLQLSPNLPYVMTITFGAADAGRAVTVVYQETGGYLSASTNCFISPVYSEQRTASEVLEELADIASCGFVWSSGMLQMRPRYVGGGSFNLTDDDFLPNQGGGGAGGGDDPVQFTRKRAADQSNIIKIEYKDRDLAYAPGVAIASDQAHIDDYGRRELGSKSMPFGNATGATYYANLLLNRQQIRTTYYFTLGAQWIILDPLDTVSISDSALGLDFAVVIILEMTENDDGSINFVAEEVLGATAATAASYTTTQSTGFQPDTSADPGPVNTPIIFEAPTELTGATPEIWVAISGASALWAGARVWLSTDGGSSYQNIGTQFGAARMGVLASLPTGADPDVTHTPSVNLTESRGTLSSVTMAQADLGLTLSIVDNELIAYETATLTATNVYTLGYIRRALDGTAQASHTAAPFARLDSLIFKHSYSTTMIGETIYLKFTSFNTYGSGEESLASVTAYPYTISGGGFGGGTGGVPATPTGLAATSAGP